MANIGQRLNKVREAVAYIRKTKRVESYMAVEYDQIVAESREAFVSNGILIVPSLVTMEVVDTGRKTSRGNPIYRTDAVFDVAFINADEPAERIVARTPGQGDDQGDKGAGKAQTYAVKAAIRTVLFLETGEDEEGRVSDTPSLIPAEELAGILDKVKAFTDVDALSQYAKACIKDAAERSDGSARKQIADAAKARYDALKPAAPVQTPEPAAPAQEASAPAEQEPAPAPATPTSDPAPERISEGVIHLIEGEIAARGVALEKVLASVGVARLADMTKEQGKKVLQRLNKTGKNPVR